MDDSPITGTELWVWPSKMSEQLDASGALPTRRISVCFCPSVCPRQRLQFCSCPRMGGTCMLWRAIYKQHTRAFFLYRQILGHSWDISAGWEREGQVAEVKTTASEPLLHVTYLYLQALVGPVYTYTYPCDEKVLPWTASFMVWWISCIQPRQADQGGNLVYHCHLV